MPVKKNSAPQNIPEEEILRGSMENPALFSILIDKYQVPFLRKAQSIVHSQEEAEDIVQETFTKMYLYAGRFKKQEGIEFKSWAWRILVNTSLTHYRKIKRTFGDVGYLDEILAKGEEADVGLPLENELDDVYRKDEINSAISRLPEDAAALLRDHYIEDRPYEEIAKKYDISIGALKMKLFRARKVLKDIMGKNN
ncbi:RNA polymerase sigma factor [Candidatus Giovannonibacteria bacterium]|nr:RNA polymerase sigma factor [Candidatus Giovannonibacteria bacterium]